MENDIQDIKKILVRELEKYFGSDTKRIDHAKKVLKFAEEILKEEQADPYVVIPTAILHDVGIKVAEAKYGSAAAHHQEMEGPAVAGDILVNMGYEMADIYEICAIIAHHHTPGPMESQNYKVVYDADWLVNLGGEVDTSDKEKLRVAIKKIFLTPTGRRLAEGIYLR